MEQVVREMCVEVVGETDESARHVMKSMGVKIRRLLGHPTDSSTLMVVFNSPEEAQFFIKCRKTVRFDNTTFTLPESLPALENWTQIYLRKGGRKKPRSRARERARKMANRSNNQPPTANTPSSSTFSSTPSSAPPPSTS